MRRGRVIFTPHASHDRPRSTTSSSASSAMVGSRGEGGGAAEVAEFQAVMERAAENRVYARLVIIVLVPFA